MRPNVPLVIAAFVATCALLLALVLADRATGHEPVEVHAGIRQADPLPDVNAYAAGLLDRTPPTAPPTTTTTRLTPKARTAPTARGARTAAAPATADIAALQAIIRDGFARFGPRVAEEAVRVAGCESTGDETGQHLDPNATGAEGEVGLLQLHPKYQSGRAAKFGWTMADLYDPYKNVAVAADLYAERGWQPWTCRYAA